MNMPIQEFAFDLRNHPAYERIIKDPSTKSHQLIQEVSEQLMVEDVDKMVEITLDATYGELSRKVTDAFEEDLRSLGYDQDYLYDFNRTTVVLRKITEERKDQIKDTFTHLYSYKEPTEEMHQQVTDLNHACLKSCLDLNLRFNVLMDYTGLPKAYFLSL